MAISRYLLSTKNIAGLALAVLAVLAQLVFGLGPLWPLIAIAAYGVGALLAPGTPVLAVLGSGGGASREELEDRLKALSRTVGDKRLENDLMTSLSTVLTNLRDIVSRWDELGAAPDQRHTVQQIIGDYLPTSLESYLKLPPGYTSQNSKPHDELLDQLRLLNTESGKIRDAVYARTLDALSDQGRFLREKFRTSSLDLGPGDGGDPPPPALPPPTPRA